MAPLPANSTGRLHIKYVANGKTHVISPRYAGLGAPPSDFLEGLDDFFILCNDVMPADWEWLESNVQLAGENISTPFAFTPTAFDGQLAALVQNTPGFMSWVGRDNLGRRVKLSLLGSSYTPGSIPSEAGDYRILASENAFVADSLAALVAAQVTTITANAPTWKAYVNVGYNAYWQAHTRP